MQWCSRGMVQVNDKAVSCSVTSFKQLQFS